MATMRRPAGVMAGGGGPAGFSAAGGFGVPLSPTGNAEDRRTTGTTNLHHLRTRVAAPLVTDGGTLVVATSHSTATALVTWRTVTGATLPPTLVSAAAPCFGAFGVTEIFFMTWHQLPVFTTTTRLLHLLSAGVAASSVTPQ